ncbi:hypothetical protein ASF04_23970 [Duganella sp. Leaf61]|uniref:hypothetical protein n=1 Tax=Duganella sp. Leaf61 TaxID=1736227 RepID=UPI0007151D3B|nr:hypothetical protein [Duganella sp. Leaf61]KQN77828.1 hypothetical protein ASF04_23970 [Duganella sp. Leaf61]
MANKFKAGMTNFVEVLNQMWDAFVVGPYNALSLAGGRVIGTLFVGSGISSSFLNPAPEMSNAVAGAMFEPFRLGVSQTPSNWPGFWSFQTSQGYGSSYKDGYRLAIRAYDSETAQFTGSLLSIDGGGQVGVAGNLHVGGLVQAGNAGAPRHGMYKVGGMSTEILWVGRQGQPSPCIAMNGSDGQGGWGIAGSVLYVGKNSSTSRSANFSGTLNASGADYAEYMVKRSDCSEVKAGQIVGIDADGRLTDRWGMAVAFAVKSTNPCMVGGDVWSSHLGPRPEAPVLVEPLSAPPVRTAVTAVLEGDSDEAWAQRLETYAAAVQSHQAATADYTIAEAVYQADVTRYDADLEAVRQTVDRIAFAGQVPVNLQGATPGQFIVPVQDGDGIAGLAIDEADITLRQYMRALGRVIAIEDDGRARIIVKVA